jgi:hypothetical protein
MYKYAENYQKILCYLVNMGQSLAVFYQKRIKILAITYQKGNEQWQTIHSFKLAKDGAFRSIGQIPALLVLKQV